MRRGRVSAACAVLVFGVWTTYTVLVLTSGGMDSPNVILFLALTVLAECLTFYRPALKVLYVSGYAADIIAHHGVLDAETELLQKPFTPPDLVRRVRQILDRPLCKP